MTRNADIIGAGIGGLTTAIVLQRRGYRVRVFEGAAELKPVGAGISLANNAMQVYRSLALHDPIISAGHKINGMRITDERLKDLSYTDLTPFEKKYGVHNVAIHRGDLQKILAEEAGHQNIYLGKRLVRIDSAEAFGLTFEDGSCEDSQVLIGADGIKSTVRNHLFGSGEIRNAHQKCWRGICHAELPQKFRHHLVEAWGRGKRFGFTEIGGGKVYWYALVNSGRYTPDLNLQEVFSGFHAEISALIGQTPHAQILLNDIIDLNPINKWQKENVCLIGDAAHATTPNLGQGACQAIEDAHVLGKLLDRGIPLEDTFAEYEALRRKKAHQIVRNSWTIGKMAHFENGLAVAARNFLVRSVPASANARQMDLLFQLATP